MTASLQALLAPRRGLLGIAAVTVILGALVELAPPLIVRQVVDAHLSPRRAEGLLPLAWLYFAAVAAGQALGFLTTYLTALAAQGGLHDLRVRFFAHAQRLPLSYYDRTPVGDLISRATADVDTLTRCSPLAWSACSATWCAS